MSVWLVVVLGALAVVPSAQAARSCGNFSGAGGDVIRVYALRA